jgi:NitT/TauT family transport system permease protein
MEKKTKERLVKSLYFLLPFLFIAVALELLVDFGVLHTKFIPSPSVIVMTLIELATREPPAPTLFDHVLGSLYRAIVGYGLGVMIGISIGILLGMNKILQKTFSPILSLLISIPTVAWVPLLLLTPLSGDETIVIAVFLGSFFPIVYNTMNGIRGIKKELIWASQIMGADKTTVFFDILMPGSLVSIITGLRLAVGYSWRALVGAEMIAQAWISQGTGYMIFGAMYGRHPEVIFAGLIIIALGGFLLDRLIMDPLERKTVERWGMVKER